MCVDQLSGRELDVAVAERVMGWRSTDRRAMGWNPNGPDVWTTGDEENPTYQEFRPSQSIEAAMRVVEAVIPRLPDNTVIKNLGFAEVRMYRYGDETWNVAFTKRGGSASATAKSLPEAICLAALKAVKKA